MALVKRNVGLDLNLREIVPVAVNKALLAAGALIVYGIVRRSWGAVGLGAAILGGGLISRQMVSGQPVTRLLGRSQPKGLPAASTRGAPGIKVERAITLNLPVAEVYRFWRQLDNLPQFMRHLESVTVLDERRSHWVARGPAGVPVAWDAEIVEDAPNALIRWRSLPGSQVEQTGEVRFHQLSHNRGTEVRVILHYDPPGGQAGHALAKLFGRDAEHEIRDDLRRFKQLLEAGEIPTVQGQPTGRQPATLLRNAHKLL